MRFSTYKNVIGLFGMKQLDCLVMTLWIIICFAAITPQNILEWLGFVGAGIIFPLIYYKNQGRINIQFFWGKMNRRQQIETIIITIVAVSIGALIGWAVVHYLFAPLFDFVPHL